MSGDIDIGSLVSEAYGEAETGAADSGVADAQVAAEPAGGDTGSLEDGGGDSAGVDSGGDGVREESAAQVAQRARDKETGRFAPKPKDIAAKAVTTKAPKTAPGAPSSAEVLPPLSGGDPSQAAPAPAAEALRAPQSLTPSEREHFAKAPPEVQRAFVRLDREVRQVMQESAPLRKAHQEYTQALAPVESLMRLRGVSAPQAMASYAQYDLALSNPATAAKAAAQLIRSYNVDISALDSELAGQVGQPQQQQAQTQQAVDPNAIVQRVLQTLQQERAQTVAQKRQAEIESFAADPANEFFGDVGHEVLAILQAAKARRVELSLKEAYDRACRAHPEVWETLQKRSEAKAAKAATASTQQAIRAASSVRSTPSTGARQPQRKGLSVRDEVLDAWEGIENR